MRPLEAALSGSYQNLADEVRYLQTQHFRASCENILQKTEKIYNYIPKSEKRGSSSKKYEKYFKKLGQDILSNEEVSSHGFAICIIVGRTIISNTCIKT